MIIDLSITCLTKSCDGFLLDPRSSFDISVYSYRMSKYDIMVKNDIREEKQ